MQDEIAVKVDHVSKNFVLPHERVNSLKGMVVGLMKGRPWRKKGTQHALRDISFEIKAGEFFGIVGRNGSGKSTLLKMIAGIYQPTEGSISLKGKLVPFIELGVGFNAELTGRENIYLNGAMMGFSKKQIDTMYEEVVAFAELEQFMDQKLKNYSSGMQVRLAFSLATRAEADILLVDEVLAVGDADFQKKCFKYFKQLKKQKKTVIFVSHDMGAVREYCDRAVLIEQSELIVSGSSHEVSMAYTRMFLEQEGSKKENLKKRKKRWGSKEITYDKISVEPKRWTFGDGQELSITTHATVNVDLAEVVLGFKIRAEDDTELVGTNTKLKDKKLVSLKKGQKITITWDLPNVFNTGRYFVDVAAQNEDYEQVYDWWEDSDSFQIEQKEDNPYPTHPLINMSVNVE